MRWQDGVTDEMDMNLGKFWRTVRNREAWCAILTGLQRGGHNWLTKQQQTNTEE